MWHDSEFKVLLVDDPTPEQIEAVKQYIQRNPKRALRKKCLADWVIRNRNAIVGCFERKPNVP